MSRIAHRRLVALVAVLLGCRKGPIAVSGSEPDGSADAPTSGPTSSPKTAVVSARCHALQPGLPLDESEGADAIDIGDGLAHGDGYAVGFVRQTRAGRMAAVALVGPSTDGVRLVDLGPTLGDAPPPRLASCGDELLAGAFAVPRAAARVAGATDAKRDLALYVVGAAGPNQPASHMAQQGDESFAFDLACSGRDGLAVWDEIDPGPPGAAARGVIRAASFGVGKHAMDARDVSPPGSDAEMPRAVADGAGFFVLWLARRPDAPPPAPGREREASTDIESPGEVRAFGWLEAVVVDATGAATGPVRRLTSTSGHVSTYDVRAGVVGPHPVILVVARDDGEAVDGEGGSLLRVRVRNDEPEAPVELPTDGLGRGPPSFVQGPASWLAWVGPREELRLLPLDEMGDGLGPPSAEEGLDEARPLLSLAGGGPVAGPEGGAQSRRDARVLVASPREKAAQLRVFHCPR
jgi:hypothetical protein